MIRRKEQEHNRRLERPVTFLVGFLTAASVAGVLQWVDDRFGIEQKWAILEAFILGVIALVFAVLLIRTRDR